MIDAIAIAVAAVLLGIAGLHVYWAVGGRWPGRDAASLNALVVGNRPGAPMPPPLLTLAVAVALVGVALAPLAARGMIALPLPSVVRPLTWVAAGVLAARGLGGFFETKLRPHVSALPYARWNRRLYSPLCLGLGAALMIVLGS